MDKITEIKGSAGNMWKSIQEGAANIDFSKVRQGLEAAGNSVVTTGAAGRTHASANASSNPYGQRGLGRVDIQIAGKEFQAQMSDKVFNDLKRTIQREGMAGAN